MTGTSRILLPRPLGRSRKSRRRPRFGRLALAALHTAALAALVAVIVHIVVILLVPRFAPIDAWAKLSGVAAPWRFSEIARPAGATGGGGAELALPNLDPRFGVIACLFDLADGPASIVAEGEVPFWSLAVFDRRGRNIYSLNDRIAIGGRLDLIVVNPAQRAQLRENPVDGLDRSILVRTDIRQGFVLVRALAPDETWVPAVRSFLRAATCERLVLPASQ